MHKLAQIIGKWQEVDSSSQVGDGGVACTLSNALMRSTNIVKGFHHASQYSVKQVFLFTLVLLGYVKDKLSLNACYT